MFFVRSVIKFAPLLLHVLELCHFIYLVLGNFLLFFLGGKSPKRALILNLRSDLSLLFTHKTSKALPCSCIHFFLLLCLSSGHHGATAELQVKSWKSEPHSQYVDRNHSAGDELWGTTHDYIRSDSAWNMWDYPRRFLWCGCVVTFTQGVRSASINPTGLCREWGDVSPCNARPQQCGGRGDEGREERGD